MFVFGNLIGSVAELLNMILTLYMWLIIIRALLSWVNPDPYNPIVNMLYRVTEPALDKVRRLIPMSGMGIDFSPIIIILIIIFLQGFLVSSLRMLASELL